ncbi:MAG: group III truncated hemoglobin [Hyphomicrobiaceae bacterium]|nr:group III truncated hemoglobin [Hyphomicrobiaceae bacterium]
MTALRQEVEPPRSGGTDRRLPLAEIADDRSVGADVLIERLVSAFYDAVRRDDLLSPIFAERVADWSLHLKKMHEFWSTIVHRTGRYAGRPLEVHLRIPGLQERHFHRWMNLWRQTVEQHVPSHQRELFIVPAARMAHSMAVRCSSPSPMDRQAP